MRKVLGYAFVERIPQVSGVAGLGIVRAARRPVGSIKHGNPTRRRSSYTRDGRDAATSGSHFRLFTREMGDEPSRTEQELDYWNLLSAWDNRAK